MKISRIINNGLRAALKNYKLLILFWCTNAAMAFILSIPIYTMLVHELKNSLMSDKLASGFDYMWFIQFMNLHGGTINQLHLVILGVVGIYALIQTFYFGGLVAIFNRPKKNHISDFFYGGVRYWYRFVKVLLISLVFFAAAFKINDFLGDFITWIFINTDNAWYDFIIRSLRYVLLMFFIGIIAIISDYARIHLAVEEKNKVIMGIIVTMRFIKNNFETVFLVFLTVAVVGAIGALIYNIIDTYVPRTPFYLLILSFILQQLLIIFRLFVRMLFCSTEVFIYKDLNADVLSVEVNEATAGV